jgi:hypothetical protein
MLMLMSSGLCAADPPAGLFHHCRHHRRRRRARGKNIALSFIAALALKPPSSCCCSCCCCLTGFASGRDDFSGVFDAEDERRYASCSALAEFALRLPQIHLFRVPADNILVRVLSACETMGNATTICSDKTGTPVQHLLLRWRACGCGCCAKSWSDRCLVLLACSQAR